ncbi:MAG: hypothetical protein K2G37_00695 [Clostridia bacterium]|nr:hypothetical protein [Clostridia bacterium]MDE7329471.1 hypothetical protein [Clostridia bacterium]
MQNQRLNFGDRINLMEEDVRLYYTALRDYLLSFKKVKNRLSIRCDSFRLGGELICKMAIGGKTLKIFLAVDATKEEVRSKKLHFRDMSSSLAYKEVPAMIPVKSELCVNKVIEVIDLMMKERGATKKNK